MSRTVHLRSLFFAMLKIGAFTFGGGYAMIALLENEFVSKKQWLDKDEFLDLTTIAESTPGPIAINSATYIGYKQAGILGAIVSTIGICIPSFFIIFFISLFFDSFLNLKIIEYAFRGIQICVIYLIFSAGLRMFKKMKKTVYNVIIFSATIAFMVTFSLTAVKFSTIFYILISGFAGILMHIIKSSRGNKNDLS